MFGLSRFSRLLVALAAVCVMYAGPVAACVCSGQAVATEMPCCPDQQPDHSNCTLPDSQVGAACDPVPADLLSAGSLDLSAPVAISSILLPLWSAAGPPPVPIPARHQPRHSSLPIYLVTLRLRN
jgi:hypothetical protein